MKIFSTAESTQSRWQVLSIPVDRIGVLAIEAPPRVIFAHTSSSTTTHNTSHEKMMSLVSTPIVAARVAAPKKAVRKTVTAKASASETAKSQAVAGALALTMLAQPAFAMSELGQIADGDKSAAAKSLAEAEFAELLAKKKAPAPVKKTKNLAVGLPSFSAPSFSAPSLPSGGASKSAPKAKAAPKAPVEKIEVRSRRDKPSTARTPCRTPANQTQNSTNPPKPGRLAASTTRRIFHPREESQLKPDPSPLPSPSRPQGSGSLGIAMVVLFSPLLAVAGLSLQTLLRVVPQAAEGKDFFPKDPMDF